MAKRKLKDRFPDAAYMVVLDNDDTVTFEDINELYEYLTNEGIDSQQPVGRYILSEVGTIQTETLFKPE